MVKLLSPKISTWMTQLVCQSQYFSLDFSAHWLKLRISFRKIIIYFRHISIIKAETTIPVWLYISDGQKKFLFFSVKSLCALVTWEEMVISSQARFLPGRKLPFPPGWRVRMTISRKKIEISFGHRLYRVIQEYNFIHHSSIFLGLSRKTDNLALCMACIQERLLIKSGLWWRAYGMWFHGHLSQKFLKGF